VLSTSRLTSAHAAGGTPTPHSTTSAKTLTSAVPATAANTLARRLLSSTLDCSSWFWRCSAPVSLLVASSWLTSASSCLTMPSV
jgi:hypothetical protein